MSNTQFKKALEFFLMDGHVTEHVQIKQDISKLYKYLCILEIDGNRAFAMLERRKEMLEEMYNQLSFVNYEHFIIEMGVELNEIIQKQYDIRYDEVKASTKAPKKS
jgi:hypothetical protein